MNHVAQETHLTMRVVDHIRAQIESGALSPGDKVPPEREFARSLKISRASLRIGIGHLVAMGVIRVRHGKGTFVVDGPPKFGSTAFEMLGSLHGFLPGQIFEARYLVEGSLATLAAERRREEHLALLAEEVAEMYAAVEEQEEYLNHDIGFHRVLAQASGNPILAALMETILTALYGELQKGVQPPRNLKALADTHRGIYRAIRKRNGTEARRLLEQHLAFAECADSFAPR